MLGDQADPSRASGHAMTDTPCRKEFTAEIRRLHAASGMPSGAFETPGSGAPTDLDRIFEEIAALRRELATGGFAGGGGVRADGAGAPDSLSLLNELSHLRRSIDQTKAELAALRRKRPPTAGFDAATNELDAVVSATETATDTILASAERIEENVRRLRGEIVNDDAVTALEDIGEKVVAIFEACNFQDITGQRITKVVGTLKLVEQTVDRMIDHLGGPSAFADAEADPAADVPDDADLLNGPPLETDVKISQDDIDKLFS
jgi:chemotaxis protein CheZ